MPDSIEVKLNRLTSQLEAVKQAEMAARHKQGEFNDELQAFLKEQGLPDTFSVVQLMSHFYGLKKTSLVLP